MSERARIIEWMINIEIAIIMCMYIYICVCVIHTTLYGISLFTEWPNTFCGHWYCHIMKRNMRNWSNWEMVCYCCTNRKGGDIGMSERARTIERMINIEIVIIMCMYIFVCVMHTTWYGIRFLKKCPNSFGGHQYWNIMKRNIRNWSKWKILCYCCTNKKMERLEWVREQERLSEWSTLK